MKIQSSQPLAPVAGTERAAPARRAGPVDGAAARISLSPQAESVRDVAREAAATPAIREDLVAETRAQLAAGTLSDHVDMDAVLDGLMADL